MPAKRSLRLEASETNKNEKSVAISGHDLSHYSPLTGTRQMSPAVASKLRATADTEERKKQTDASPRAAEPGPSSRGQSSPEENAEFLRLFAEVEGSLDELLKMRRELSEAVGGSSELGNLFGSDSGTLDLKSEMQKTKVLICEVRKRKKRQRLG